MKIETKGDFISFIPEDQIDVFDLGALKEKVVGLLIRTSESEINITTTSAEFGMDSNMNYLKIRKEQFWIYLKLSK